MASLDEQHVRESSQRSASSTLRTRTHDAAAQAERISAQSATRMAATGVAIFAVNMLAAWIIAYSSSGFISQSLAGSADGPISRAMIAVTEPNADANRMVFMTRVIEAEVHFRSIANKQSIIMVSMAAGFGFLALGFSLFIMGMKGAVELAGGRDDLGKIAMRSTSPGLLCFVLAAILVGYPLSKESQISFGALSYTPSGPAVPPPVTPAPAEFDETELRKTLQIRK